MGEFFEVIAETTRAAYRRIHGESFNFSLQGFDHFCTKNVVRPVFDILGEEEILPIDMHIL